MDAVIEFKKAGPSTDSSHTKKGDDNGPLDSKALESGNSKELVTGQVKVGTLDPVSNENNNPKNKVVEMTAETILYKFSNTKQK